ncbi:hypothetical protein BDY21DRAFT_355548 [Lineolata rhizophorae]|uniref:Threonine/serine exporter-like N-terminal domain-containing protein n=1 Tax=Lineolata rhizophorae TaxID=578093 RepID=A0A6A6NPG8_9PEZI|nr:hypothetical protein BDY21DRAFT_355548 [Lineolata rhizophorae]
MPEAEPARDTDEEGDEKYRSGRQAQERAQRLAKTVGSYSASAPTSRRSSVDGQEDDGAGRDSIPLMNMGSAGQQQADGSSGFQNRKHSLSQAETLVRSHTRAGDQFAAKAAVPGLRSGQVTPDVEAAMAHHYVAPPQQYRGGILGSLLKLYNQSDSDVSPGSKVPRHHRHDSSGSRSGTTTPIGEESPSSPPSGASTPKQKPLRNWFYNHSPSHSTTSLARLVGTSSVLGSPAQSEFSEQLAERLRQHEKRAKRASKSSGISSALGLDKAHKRNFEEEIRITVHIAETISRQRYLLKLCKALMQYGAPTHRLEEYMKMSARVLEIEGQFLYIPGCMIISFDDPSTHTTEVKLIRTSQGVDLGKLRDVHEIYKEVVHDKIGVEEATQRLEEVTKRKPKFRPWLLVPVYGCASVCVAPFAFEARFIDLPIAFFLGSLLGWLQLIVAPQSELYANVFEISAAVITSFLARAFGSIKDGNLFCFSALAQSSIALILPGYTVLCASLELQSRSLVAGSVRMVYAIIYSLILGFGITIGTVIYGWLDQNATSAVHCKDPMSQYQFFPFVPGFTICLIIINQGKYKQIPVMLVISFAGYLVNFFSSKHFEGNNQISSTLGAFTIGILANLYSRLGRRFDNWSLDVYENKLLPWIHKIRNLPMRPRSTRLKKEDPDVVNYTPRQRKVGYGLAAAAMLPAIFVQVPSGLAVSGSLVSGITSADQITGNNTGTTTVSPANTADGSINSIAFNVSYSVIQVAIGITVGLFLAALTIYPLGKRRSGLFSF